jgi:type IV pilus assembly protein PilQ
MDRAGRDFTAFRGNKKMNKQTWAFKFGCAMRRAVLSVVMLAGAVPLLAKAENSIQAISGSIQGGTEIVRVEMAEPVSAVPTGFSIQAPARIALDFQGVTSSLGRSAIELNVGNVRSANLIQSGERTRLVLNLKTPTTYRAEIQGKFILIMMDAQTAAASPAVASSTFAENKNRDTRPLKDIDFRRGPNGAGLVVVGLANTQVGVDIRQQGKTLVVEFMKTALPKGCAVASMWLILERLYKP